MFGTWLPIGVTPSCILGAVIWVSEFWHALPFISIDGRAIFLMLHCVRASTTLPHHLREGEVVMDEVVMVMQLITSPSDQQGNIS
jgi:hypothetical protein